MHLHYIDITYITATQVNDVSPTVLAMWKCSSFEVLTTSFEVQNGLQTKSNQIY